MKEIEINLRNIDYILNLYNFNSVTFLIFISISMGIVVDGLEMTLMALFLIPIKKFYNLSNFELQIISSILFIGFALGCYLNGFLLSKFRRRQIIINSYIAVFIFHTILSFVPYIIIFSISRFFIGFFLGLIIPISLNSLSEFLPIKNRAFLLTSIWAFLSIGQGCNAIFMLIGMPNFEIDNMKYVIFSLNILIIIAFVLNDNFYLESPRYLLMKNENEETFNFLNQMLIQINEEKLSDEEKENIINENNKNNNIKQENEYITLFSKKYYQTTILSIGITFILSFLFYGIILISTLTMKDFNKMNNQIIKNNSITLNINNTINNNTNNKNDNIIKNLGDEDLNKTNNYKKILLSQIISAFLSMFGCLIGGAFSEIPYFGRKKTTYYGFIIICICLILILLIGKDFFTEFYSIYLTATIVSFNVYLTYIVEVYPTKVRDISSGFLFGCLRVGGFLSQFIYLSMNKIHFLFPYFFSFLMATLGAFFTYKLPYETCNQPLDFNLDSEENENDENEKLIN